MEKLDLKKRFKRLYSAGAKGFEQVEVPPLRYVMVDGTGDPNTAPDYAGALAWLYGASYAMKFAAKAAGQDYIVPPLEGLWWAEDYEDFVRRRRENWHWTMMIMVPELVTEAMFSAAVEKTKGKLGIPPSSLRLAALEEGVAVQILHVGPYDDEGPLVKRLHEEYLPANRLVENGLHHEIYLSDPRKTEPSRLRTILRQPVKAAS